jgi:hypothetical protein
LVFGFGGCGTIGDWWIGANPGPQVEQGKIDQILSYVKNQENESKVIKQQMVKLDKQEMAETRKSTDALGLKFD